ncbi:MAG: hypothetical protein L0Y66_14135 [Myxococcaceae bacterium]|nr:hypothetical protein [Myxococcaceae bacterium]MCI0673870.1 hypothetical protein [Myxococcaceae bacterium]
MLAYLVDDPDGLVSNVRNDCDHSSKTIDGLAHMGMLPDVWQDMRNVGVTWEQLTPLFNSANGEFPLPGGEGTAAAATP